jgi:hypothetical protein
MGDLAASTLTTGRVGNRPGRTVHSVVLPRFATMESWLVDVVLDRDTDEVVTAIPIRRIRRHT